MNYGSILGDVSYFYVSTADGIHQEVKNNLITKSVLKLLGIPHIGLRIRAGIIFNFLNPENKDVVLDAGCGMGLYLLTLAKKIYHGYGVDIDASKIKEATRLTKELSINNITFRNTDAVYLDFPDAFFDKIICSEVLEHVKEEQGLVKGFFRMLKNRGTMVISTTSLSKINREHENKFGHERIGYSLKQLKALFIDSGFSIEKILPYCLFFGKISWKINRGLLSKNLLNTISFYPLMLFASLDKFLSCNLESDCIGYIIKLKKE